MEHNPTQEEMRSAHYSKRYNYAIPFRPVDEVFIQVCNKFPEFESYYWISNYGTLYNAKLGYYHYPIPVASYYVYSMRKTRKEVMTSSTNNSPFKNIAIGLLVCTCFVSDKPGINFKIRYKDGNVRNNYYKNLEWAQTYVIDEPTKDMTNYWNNDVYTSAAYSNEQVHRICELLQSGITDLGTISNEVFGCPPTPQIYALIRRIRSGQYWTNISSQYETIPGVERRKFTASIIIHGMCNYMKNNPDTAYTADLYTVLKSFGVEPNMLTQDELHRYSNCLYQLRYKGAYRKVADQYNIPLYKDGAKK